MHDSFSRMAGFRLFGETVFQFNDQYRKAWRASRDAGDQSLGYLAGYPDKVAYFVPSFFEKSVRAFRWVALAGRMLDMPDPAGKPVPIMNAEKTVSVHDALAAMRPHVYGDNSTDKTPSELWQTFKALLIQDDHCETASKIVEDALWEFHGRKPAERLPYVEALFEADREHGRFYELCRALILLYSCFPINRRQYIEGTFFRYFEDNANDVDRFNSEPMYGQVFSLGDKTGSLKLWFDATEWTSGDQSRHMDRRAIINQINPKYDLKSRVNLDDEDLGVLAEYNARDLNNVQRTFFEDAFLLPLLKNDPLVEGLDDLGTVASFGVALAERDEVLILPVYDFWESGRGVGGIKAVYIVFFVKDSGTRVAWHEAHKARIQTNFERLSQAMAATAATTALAIRIEAPYDLVRHFLKILVFVQDWEEACVFQDDKPLYRYRRDDDGIRSNWIYDKPEESAPAEQFTGMKADAENWFFMWWTNADKSDKGIQNLWRADFLQDLTGEERATVSGLSIRFKFPRACRIPGEEGRAFLVESCRRQQLDLMRALIPKVRARRAALRSAVSAIMGRNMSHNIGSHVLARYAGRIAEEKGSEGRLDARVDFLAYLQRRMDFLAEVATSDRAFWSQPMLLGQQLKRFNLEEQCKLFWNAAPTDEVPGRVVHQQGQEDVVQRYEQKLPLLSNITGKHDLIASVDFKIVDAGGRAQGDLLFSCPGGEVGLHALYIILENVIRNSARHGGAGSSSGVTGRVNIRVDASHGDPGLIEVAIIDPRTRLHPDQSLCKSLKPECAGGCQENSYRVVDDVNRILAVEPILDPSGAPNAKYWGLREMQVCAHYLRRLPLSDLESEPLMHSGYSTQARVIEAKVHENGTERCLSYVIRLEAAKLLALVERGEPNEDGDNESTARARWWVQEVHQLAKIAPKIADYAFAATDDETIYRWMTTPGAMSAAGVGTADFPVRRLKLVNDGKSDGEIKGAAAKALFADDDLLAGLEQLHKMRAYQYRDRRVAWNGRGLAGIATVDDCLGSSFPGASLPQSVAGVPLTLAKEVAKALPVGWPWIDKAVDGGNALGMAWIDHPSPGAFANTEVLNCEEGCDREGGNFRWVSAEGVFHGSPHADLLCSLGDQQVGWELIAAALPRVAVLDERIQDSADTTVRGLPCASLWQHMGVWVPHRDVANLTSPELDKCQQFLARPTDWTSQLPIDHVIVHLTVLEKLTRAQEGKTIGNIIAEMVADTCAQDAEIFIVTGRGVPTVARAAAAGKDASASDLALRNVRYLPISALLEYLVSRPSKLGLMRVLWSAARPRRHDA